MMFLASHTTWQECACAKVIDVCGDGGHPFNVDMLDKFKMELLNFLSIHLNFFSMHIFKHN